MARLAGAALAAASGWLHAGRPLQQACTLTASTRPAHSLPSADISSTAEDIRRCRQEILALPDGQPTKNVVSYLDFFTDQRMPRHALSRAGAPADAARDRGVHRGKRYRISSASQSMPGLLNRFPGVLSAGASARRPRALAPLRDRQSRHFRRHVSVLDPQEIVSGQNRLPCRRRLEHGGRAILPALPGQFAAAPRRRSASIRSFEPPPKRTR